MNLIDKFHNWRRMFRWNKQYKSGRWESLKSEAEKVRYQTIIDHIVGFNKTAPTILDLGCGEGVLLDYLKSSNYSLFYGMDFSKVSIKKALAKKTINSVFKTADIHSFNPSQNFDIILFNEIFYYIHKTERTNVINRMLDRLNENGIIIVSIFREGVDSWEIIDNHENLEKTYFKTVKSNIPDKYWKIGVYKRT